jgi:carboxymethylenebutenolidase
MRNDDMLALWAEHQQAEFEARDVERTLATMANDPHILNVPVMVGGRGRDGVARFYREGFIPGIPDDLDVTDLSTTVGTDRIVAERVMAGTHSVAMPWLLPGVDPTHRRFEVPHVVIVHVADDGIVSEHIYWDQATVLVQVGLLDEHGGLPVAGSDQARQVREMATPD